MSNPYNTVENIALYREKFTPASAKIAPPTFNTKIKQFVTSVVVKLSGLNATLPALMLDLSEYNSYEALNLDDLRDNGIVCLVFRSSSGSDYQDPHVVKFVAMAKAAGFIIGLYHWHDPTDPLAPQEIFFSKLIDALKPDFAALDIEQWWSDWSLWYQALFGKIPWASVPIIPSGKISSDALLFYQYLVKRYPLMKIFIYTGYWFILQYARAILTWIGTVNTWMAQYTTQAIPTTWAGLWQFVTTLSGLVLPTQIKQADFWQFTSSFKIPGTTERKDASRFRGTLADLEVFLGITSIPNPTPTPDPTPIPTYELYYVVPSWLTVRAGPGSTYKALSYLEGLGDKVKTTVTEYKEVSNLSGEKWIRINPLTQTVENWVNEAYLQAI